MKITTTTKLMLALILGCSAVAAQAQNVIEENVTFQPEADTVYEFVPSIDGNLTITVDGPINFYFIQNWAYLLFNSADHNDNSGIPLSSYNEPAPNVTDFIYQNLEAGKTYYFYTTHYVGVDCTFNMSEYLGESISKVTPSTLNPFNYVANQEIQISGSSAITSMGTATLKYGETTVELDPEVYTVGITGGGGNYFIQIRGLELQKLISEVAYSGEESFTITVTDVKANGSLVVDNSTREEGVVVEDGTVSITYDVFPAPQYLEADSYWPDPFYASWSEGDESGIANLVFDQEIQSVGTVTLMMGYFEAGMITNMDYYDLTSATTVDGKNIKIDFTGASRPSNASRITVIVQDVKGINGVNANLGSSPEELNGTLFTYLPYSSSAAPEEPTTPEYMEGEATQVNFEISEADTVLELLWPETVYMQDTEVLEIPVYYEGELVGNLSSTYINLVGDGDVAPANATRAESGESGTVMYVLLGASSLLEDPGTYTVIIPEGMVANADGQINKPQEFEVVYVVQAEGVISPESGTIYAYGEDVVITITYDGMVEISYSEDAPVIVSNYADYDESLEWTADVLYVEGNTIVINLGNELTPGYYYLSLREAQVTVDGAANAPIYDYMFQVAEGESGISTVGTSEGVNNVYNLNGVKVNQNNLKAGVYIINGKKVVVK